MDRSPERGGRALRWSFGRAVFDEARWQLSVDGEAVALERKPLEVLGYLLRHAGEAVTRDELLAGVWSGRVVVEAVLTNAVGKLRRALGAEAAALVTLPRIGYRLDAAVQWSTVEAGSAASGLEQGHHVPRRSNWRLEESLADREDAAVWLARHIKTGQARVFKFSLGARRLGSLKREVTVTRLLDRALGERPQFVRIIDWDFEQAPYFIEFEYGGVGFDRWRDAQGQGVETLPLATRLALFREIADAVAAAHAAGVLHKDLKPANLLLDDQDGALQPRVADFGSARLFDAGVLERLGITRVGLGDTVDLSTGSGTPLYLAPEVVAGQTPNIRSDVYALGVILFQLVVGDFKRQLSPGWEADIDDPLLREDIAAAAHGDPARRLPTASALSERLGALEARRLKRAQEEALRGRIAEGEARLARFRARRPWMLAAGVALALGLGATGWLLERSMTAERLAAEQRRQAEMHARRAEAVVQYLSNDLIRALAPGGRGFERDPTIKEMIEHASATIETNFISDPVTRASLAAALGASWESLYDPARAAESYRRAWQDYARALGESNELTLLARYDLGGVLAAAEKFDDAREVLDGADRLAAPALGREDRLALWAAWKRGVLLKKRMALPEAEEALQRALQLHARVMPDEQGIAARISLALADVRQRQGKFTEVIAQMRAALADPNLRGEELRNDYRTLLAKMISFQNKDAESMAEAVALAMQAAESTAKLRGHDALQTLVRYGEVGRAYARSGQCEKALEVYRHIWDTGFDRHGPASLNMLTFGGALAGRELSCGDREVGMALQRRIGGYWEQHFPDEALAHAYRYTLATRMIDDGQFGEALDLLGRIDATRMAAATSSPAAKYWIDVQRGRGLMGLGDRATGRRLIATALDGIVAMGIDPESPGIVKARSFLDG